MCNLIGKIMDGTYESPQVEVIEVMVESGFCNSLTPWDIEEGNVNVGA